MALYGYIDDLARILTGDPRFAEGFRYLKRCVLQGSAENARLLSMSANGVEKVPLEDGSVAIDQVYQTRERSNCVLESHLMNIDVQFILEGEEVMDVIPIRDLSVKRPYKETSDVILYHDPGPASRLRVRAGQAAIFFPEDGHMPGQYEGESALVRKIVIKVPVGPK